jgi:hypothetical protein
VRQFWKTGIALLLLVGLGLYIWRYEWGQEVGPDEPKETILSIESDKAQALSIESSGEAPIRLSKVDGVWHVASPFEAPADEAAVAGILTRLEKLEAEEIVVEETQDVAQYGLDAPSRSVSVTLEGDGEPLVVDFGSTAPGGSAVYARTPTSSRVYTVEAFIESSFDQEPFDLRDRDLLHAKRGDVRTLQVRGPEGDYTLTRTDAGDWSFTEPLTTRAGRWTVDGLLGTLENLKMESVAEEEAGSLAPYGLDRPSRSVRLVLADGTTRTLEIGSPAGDTEAGKFHAREKGSSLVAIVPGAIVTNLEKGMGELRAKKLLEVATYDTVGFDVDSEGTTRTYEKTSAPGEDGLEKTQWTRTAPDEAPLETTTVEDALFKIGGVEVQEFVDEPSDLAAYGLGSPQVRVTIRAKSESWIELGEKGEEHYARRSSDDAVLKLEPVKARELMETLAALDAASSSEQPEAIPES